VRPYSKIMKIKGAEGMAQVVKHLPGKCKHPVWLQKKKKKGERERERECSWIPGLLHILLKAVPFLCSPSYSRSLKSVLRVTIRRTGHWNRADLSHFRYGLLCSQKPGIRDRGGKGSMVFPWGGYSLSSTVFPTDPCSAESTSCSCSSWCPCF
jgi:hypothetical protein